MNENEIKVSVFLINQQPFPVIAYENIDELSIPMQLLIWENHKEMYRRLQEETPDKNEKEDHRTMLLQIENTLKDLWITKREDILKLIDEAKRK